MFNDRGCVVRRTTRLDMLRKPTPIARCVVQPRDAPTVRHASYGAGVTYIMETRHPGSADFSCCSHDMLPLQNEPDSSQQHSRSVLSSSNFQHGFERIQFKSATANNGRRGGQQQYYKLIVKPWANIQNSLDETPKWVEIAARSSQRIVVRGRSPSHYQGQESGNAGAGRGTRGSGPDAPGLHGLG